MCHKFKTKNALNEAEKKGFCVFVTIYQIFGMKKLEILVSQMRELTASLWD